MANDGIWKPARDGFITWLTDEDGRMLGYRDELGRTWLLGQTQISASTPLANYSAPQAEGEAAVGPALTAIEALSYVADKGLYATGVDTFATYDLTAAARSVLDDATVAAMVDTLGGAASTGSGGLARATSPTFVTPVLGVAIATTINKVAITAPSTSATLTIANDKTLTVNNTIAFTGTDATVMTLPSTSQTLAGLAATQTLTNKTIDGSLNTLSNLPAANISGVIPIANLATGTPTGTKFIRDDGTLVVPTGSGDVAKVGTPVDNQVGVWTGNGTIEGDAALTFNTTTDTLAIGASGKLAFGAVNILDDTTGTTTLSNIDALDATTEATIEAAIDTLANLVSVQGHTVTLTGALVRSGAHSLTLTTTGTTSLTLPTSGTLVASNASATLSIATNLVRATHGNRLLVCDTAATHTVEDDTTGAWADSDVLYGFNTSAGNVVLQGDGTSTVTAEAGYTLTVPAGASWSLSRTGSNAWRGGAIDPDIITLAGLTATTDNIIQSAGSAWASRTPAQFMQSMLGADPNADRLVFWDDSAGAFAYLTAGSGLTITGTTITASAGATLIGHLCSTFGWSVLPSQATFQPLGAGAMLACDSSTLSGQAGHFNSDQGRGRIRHTAAAAAANRSAGARCGVGQVVFIPTVDPQSQSIAARMWMAAIDGASACRNFLGLVPDGGEPSLTVDPSAWTHWFGVYSDAADTNLKIGCRATGTVTFTDLGANFPANSAGLNGIELAFTWVGGTTPTITYTVTNTATGSTATGTITTNLPTNTLLNYQCSRNSAANTTPAMVVDIGPPVFGVLSGL